MSKQMNGTAANETEAAALAGGEATPKTIDISQDVLAAETIAELTMLANHWKNRALVNAQRFKMLEDAIPARIEAAIAEATAKHKAN